MLTIHRSTMLMSDILSTIILSPVLTSLVWIPDAINALASPFPDNDDDSDNMMMTSRATMMTRTIVQQGTVSSEPPSYPGDNVRIVQILPPREDGSIYTGTLTFTASKEVSVGVFHIYSVNRSSLTVINSSYGEPASAPIAPGQSVALSIITPDYGENSFIPSASLPFSGNALFVLTQNHEPFIVTYSLKAEIDRPSEINNNITSALISADNINNITITTSNASSPSNIVTIVPNATFIGDKSFEPNPINVRMGDIVTWINKDSETHTVTSGYGPDDWNLTKQFDSGLFGQNQMFSYTFKTSGEFTYFCQLHPNMKGKVIVTN